MPLAPGKHLGPYEITGPLGSGGMGEVYRATDTRLGRTVAIKILPSHLSEKPNVKQRFEREARAISSLQHPNICALYDIGHQDGTDFLVLEYLEGETLSRRLAKGPLATAQVLKCGIEICEGLEKAHRSGVMHRDLKPGNIMLTNTGAKLLDFGLAKPLEAAPAGGLTSLPTSSKVLDAAPADPLTAEGTVVGTFQYISPEQLEGKEADARSDIFALGAMLYEMATGKRAFEGQSQASVIAAILERDPPPISQLQPMSPPALDDLVRICLAKNADERWQAVHDVKIQLQRIAAGGSQAGVPASVLARRKGWDRAGWLLAAALSVFLIGGGTVWWFQTHHASPAMHFYSPVPFSANDVALSPDGKTLAMVAYSDQANNYVIWTYEVGGTRTTAVPGTEDASHPFWSPDGRSIGFFANGKLKKADVPGGSAQVLCDAPNGRGGTWNAEGTILFSPDGNGGLYRVSTTGGTPLEVTKPDVSRSETSHRWPIFLPDGRHFLYLGANFAGEFEKNAIFLGSLDSNERRLIVSTSSNAVYADPGYLLYLRDNALVAQRFDSRSYVLSGEPRTITDEVQYLPQIDLALFSVAGKKTLVSQTGERAAKSRLTWIDRSGRPTGTVGPAGTFSNPSLSPDGRRVAVDQYDPQGRIRDIWIHGIASDAAARFTFGPSYNNGAIWSPDGRRIMFASNRKNIGLYQKNADGTGPEELIAGLGGAVDQLCWNWSHDGKYVLARKGQELWYVSLADRQAKPFLQVKGSVRNAQFSPDGKWVAYSTNETGNWEVYVSPFPNPNSKWQVSRGGGEEPRWRRDGKELFYLSAEKKMMSVAVKTGSNFEAGPSITLFQTHPSQAISVQDVFSYDLTADGQRFLINTKVDEPNAAHLSIILNWASEMEK